MSTAKFGTHGSAIWKVFAIAGCVCSTTFAASGSAHAAASAPTQALYRGSAAAQPTSSGSTALAATSCNSFETHGDNVHYPGSDVSGHGWWINRGCPTSLADVTVQLEAYYTDGRWHVIDIGHGTYRSGGGGGSRATARALCRSRGGPYSFRTIVDVDLVGVNDPSGVGITPVQNLYCRL